MKLSTPRALRDTRILFGRIVNQMQEMHEACQVRPSEGSAVILPVAGDDGAIALECRPVVCRVPERAKNTGGSVFVVFEGLLTFGEDDVEGELATLSYSTNFGYFVRRGDTVLHALGGHYDYVVGQIAHPRAHLQLASQAGLHANAVERFPSIRDVPLNDDLMPRVLNRVRTPTAQMDFLSFMVQICADHLVDDTSVQSVSAFQEVSASCAPFKG